VSAALVVVLVACGSGAAAAASPASQACQAAGSPLAPAVIELYTSEGCDSCPPADRWLSGLRGRTDVIPLAFHVDYWDRLGWKDRFASPAYTARQQDVQRRNGSRVSYTPQVVVNGSDWRGWSTRPLPAPAAAGADLRLIRIGRRVEATVTPRPGSAPLAGYWAVVEDDHVTAVKAGENRGATLRHDHVVRAYLPVAGAPGDATRTHAFEPPVPEDNRPRRVVFVVTDERSGRPVQAAALGC
jgi:hypothetical protein